MEYLFEFHSDPLQATAGKVTVTDRLGDRLLKPEADFNVIADKQGRRVSINRHGATIYKMNIAPDGQWASLDDPTELAAVFKARLKSGL